MVGWVDDLLSFPGLRVCWFMIPKMDKPKKMGKSWFVST